MSEIKNKISEYFSSQSSVGLVYFFGSRANGTFGAMSDYDFAIYLSEGSQDKRSALRIDFITELIKILNTDKVDVVILNDLYVPEMKYQIICEGQLLFEREPYRLLVEPRILNEYFDFKTMLRKYNFTKSWATKKF